jgi:coiled-coil domain-containing protein 55
MQSKRNAKTEEQKEADKERKPKYAPKIILATQKRQMEKLMVDERKQAKEREAEGDEFIDKEAFVTGAYKQQIEERERIRKELEEQDRMDNRLKVEDQTFWQANFNRKLLDDISDVKPIDIKAEEMKKETVVEEDYSRLEQEKKLFRELKPGLNQPKTLTKSKKSLTPERRSSRHDNYRRKRSCDRRRSSSREGSRHRRRRHDSSASPQRSSKENSNRTTYKQERPKSDKEILYERLEKIKEILKQRNSESEIFMARQRYLQRKQNGEIRAPI